MYLWLYLGILPGLPLVSSQHFHPPPYSIGLDLCCHRLPPGPDR